MAEIERFTEVLACRVFSREGAPGEACFVGQRKDSCMNMDLHMHMPFDSGLAMSKNIFLDVDIDLDKHTYIAHKHVYLSICLMLFIPEREKIDCVNPYFPRTSWRHSCQTSF